MKVVHYGAIIKFHPNVKNCLKYMIRTGSKLSNGQLTYGVIHDQLRRGKMTYTS